MSHRILNSKGQSTIEFALAVTFLVPVIFFFLRLCLLLGYGNYVHYATFMAARAYLSSGPDKEDQERRARTVVVRSLKKSLGQPGQDRIPSLARGQGGGDVPGMEAGSHSQFNPDVPTLSWLQGVRYTFRSRLMLFPGDKSAEGDLILTSEAWLGRETDEANCKREMKIRNNGILDNGC